MKIVITGHGDSQVDVIGQALASHLGLKCASIDTSSDIASLDWHVSTVEASVMLDSDRRRMLRDDSIIVLIVDSLEPTALDAISPFADMRIEHGGRPVEEIVTEIADLIGGELAIRFKSANTFGEVVRVTTFGESHGPAIGAVLDGVRPGIEITAADIQSELDRRRPGQSTVTTPRRESDQVHILSGVFKGLTTGAPIAMVIYNRDQDPSKYESLRDIFRPGHADFTFYKKYGLRDYRGGGRSSGRETAGRVACGAIAKKQLAEQGVRIVAHSVEIAGIKAQTCDLDAIEKNVVRCADPVAAKKMEEAILKVKESNDSVGGIAQLEIHGVPAGLGDPVFFKLDARLTYAIMTIGATKGVEVGRGFELARLRGSESNDPMTDGGFLSNNAGGITGGISTGQPITLRVAVKPTSSIAQPQKTIDLSGQNREIEVHGRHDPCIMPRIIPVIENMAALVILDAWEIQSRLRPEWDRA
ncbi:MAG: chorismate synthase [Candidatus Zixiibacteriota bacterium]